GLELRIGPSCRGRRGLRLRTSGQEVTVFRGCDGNYRPGRTPTHESKGPRASGCRGSAKRALPVQARAESTYRKPVVVVEDGTQGSGSHEPVPIAVPPAAVQLSAVSSSQSGPPPSSSP